VGGKASTEDGKPADSAELYDPTTGKWDATASMAQARSDHTATLLQDGMVLVAGGQPARLDQSASAELYDPNSGQWTATGSMRKARNGHTATQLPDGKVLVAGGYDIEGGMEANVEGGMGRTTAELYDPDTGRWTATGSMTVPRAGHTATLLPDGRVLVAGGDRGEMDGGRSAELYDPGTGRWTATGSMTDDRSNHPATLLIDGRVPVTGGFSGSGYTVDAPCSGPPEPCSAELYDPGSGQWTGTGKMHADRIGHTANLLADGTVLVVGLGTGVTPASAELYDPSTGRVTCPTHPEL
jgi:N-acetylneuraminic acid mutarotase